MLFVEGGPAICSLKQSAFSWGREKGELHLLYLSSGKPMAAKERISRQVILLNGVSYWG